MGVLCMSSYTSSSAYIRYVLAAKKAAGVASEGKGLFA